MTSELRRRSYWVTHKRVERLQADYGLYAKDGWRKKVRTTIPTSPPCPTSSARLRPRPTGPAHLRRHHLRSERRRFALSGRCPRYRLQTDGPLCHGGAHPQGVVEGILEMVVDTRGGDVAGMVFHHDRAAQYMDATSESCAGATRSHVGREDRFEPGQRRRRELEASLKRELVSRYGFATRAEARRAITALINRTTPCACIRHSATCHQSSGNYAIACRDLLAA